MNDHNWKLWTHSRHKLGESRLWRYGVAGMLPLAAALIVNGRPPLIEAPFFVFLGAVVVSALNGGLAPAFVTTALSALLIRLVFVHPPMMLFYGNDAEGMERMGGFILVSMLIGSFVSAVRGERNQLRESEERYRMLAESAADALIVINEQGEILYANPVTENIFGRKPGTLVGQNLTLLLPGRSYHTQLDELKHHLDTRKKPVAIQLPAVHENGGLLLVEMTLGTCCRRNKNIFTAVLRDITAHPRGEPSPR